MRRAAGVLLACALVAVVSAQDARTVKNLEAKVQAARDALDRVKNQSKIDPFAKPGQEYTDPATKKKFLAYPSKESRDKAAKEKEEELSTAQKELDDEIAAWQKAKADRAASMIVLDKMKVGDKGVICYTSAAGKPCEFEAFQVIDKANVILKVWYPRGSSMPTRLLWAEVPTAGMVDGERVNFRRPVEVKGTKTYKTSIGSKTVFVVAPLKDEPKKDPPKDPPPS